MYPYELNDILKWDDKMPRMSREKSSTGIYHIILRGINKQIIFEDIEYKEKFLELLQRYKEGSQYEIYAYCIMDNHVHILVKEGYEEISETMKRIGVSYVYWYNCKYDRNGHLFQDRYKSEPVEDDKYLLTVLRYIHQNPLKAGIAGSVAEYQWSSHKEYEERSNIVNTQFILGMLGNIKGMVIKGYKEFMKQIGNEECLEIKALNKLNDKEALVRIKKQRTIQSLEELRRLDNKERDDSLRKLKAIDGISIRQIARITGFTVNIVAKV